MPTLRVGHSPDADDAFMFYALANEIITIKGFNIKHVLEEIQGLNKRAMAGDLEVTAISAAVYPMVSNHYRIMSCGASVGRNYGPALVSKIPLSYESISGKRIGVPGQDTTAYMLMQIFTPHPFEPVFLPFDEVTEAVQTGKVDAGILIHEGQIRSKELGLHLVLDLGQTWFHRTQLPIPLGLDLVHRRLGNDLGETIAKALRDAIVHSRNHEDDALDYALDFGRGIDKETARQFVRMYVNDDTVNFGNEGRRALETLYKLANEKGLIPNIPTLDIIEV